VYGLLAVAERMRGLGMCDVEGGGKERLMAV
jgi:hypothetical protein